MPSSHDLERLRMRLGRVRAGEPLVITTSGSTEQPKRVSLSWAALSAAAEASAQVIGAGNWLLAVPVDYIAGVMVDVRAQLAQAKTRAFGSESFAAATTRVPSPRYVSLVPRQLEDILESVDATRALATYAAVLVGGQRLPGALRERATAAGVRVIATYGSTETSGGCVYDGRPLPGVELRVDDDDRLWVAGPMLADGYVNADGTVDVERTAASFVEHEGRRWYRTDDRAVLHTDEHGVRLEILGRADEVIISGGLKLDVAEVQRFLDQVLGSESALALPLDGTVWGQSLGVWRFDVGLGAEPPVSNEALSVRLRDQFGVAATPVISGGCVRLLDNGKPDRAGYIEVLMGVAGERGLLGSMVGDE